MEELWPVKRSGHISVAIENLILVWGGYTDPQHPEEGLDIYLPPNEVWLYNSSTFKWNSLDTTGDHPPGLSGAQAIYLPTERSIYVLCGFMAFGHANEVYQLDITTWSWTEVIIDESHIKPSPRDKFGAWEFDNRIYIFGGYGPDYTPYLHKAGSFFPDFTSAPMVKGWNNQLLAFDTRTRSWTNPQCTGCVPSPRAAHGVARIGNETFLFGGRHDNSRLNDLYSLNMLNLQWTKILVKGDIPVGRSWHTLTPLSNNRICLFGGYTTNCETLGDAWYLDTDSLCWRQVSLRNTQPRLWHTAACTMNGEVIVFGGCSNDILSASATVHTGELLILHMFPKTLLRLCLDAVYLYKDLLEGEWPQLPRYLSAMLSDRSFSNRICCLC